MAIFGGPKTRRFKADVRGYNERQGRFIQRAIKHPGSLRAFAKKHRALNENGTIDLAKAKRVAERLPEPAKAHRLRQINLAMNLRRLRA